MSKPIIEVKGISKCYKLGSIGAQTMRDEVEAFFARFKKTKPLDPAFAENSKLKTANSAAGSSEFWALRDVSFDVQPGEVVGIIGRNGAGKSTLLKILSRITEPTSGEIRVRGRIASLLEVGTGFHPELSGRENIFLNGAILGMTKAEIRAKFDEIVDFAGVEQFIDTPVKRYSSGMYVRLAFAVAAHLEPEILIVDEVLAVGDAEFQKKCLGKLKDVAGHGRTVLFVSHNMGALTSLCSKAMWLEKSTLRQVGSAREIVNEYLTVNPSHVSVIDFTKVIRSISDTRLRLLSLTWLSNIPLQHGQPLRARIEFQIASSVEDLTVGIGFSTLEGVRLVTYETDYQDGFRPCLKMPGVYSVEAEFDELPLGPAVYALDVGCRSGDSYCLDYVQAVAQIEIVPGPKTPGYIVRQDAGIRLLSSWKWLNI
jgi:lipopolysaccharide transport system ATP-binding protein